jgi:hypothetical protein
MPQNIHTNRRGNKFDESDRSVVFQFENHLVSQNLLVYSLQWEFCTFWEGHKFRFQQYSSYTTIYQVFFVLAEKNLSPQLTVLEFGGDIQDPHSKQM